MATGNLAKDFSDEATCFLCKEHFRDPVMVDCGHNFCQVCITQCIEKAESGPSCPQCRLLISPGNFRPNCQLANFVELVKKFQQEKQEEEKRGVCGKHMEPMKLFCMKDRMCICVVCGQSKEHKAHQVLPLEEAFEEYKKRIMKQIPSLVKKRDELKALCSGRQEKSMEIVDYLEELKGDVLTCLCDLKSLVEGESIWLHSLDNLQKEMKKAREENAAELSKQISDLDGLIAEVENCQKPAGESLQGIAETLEKCNSAKDTRAVSEPDWEETVNMWTERVEAFIVTVSDCATLFCTGPDEKIHLYVSRNIRTL